MGRRYGWGLDNLFGLFMSVAAAVIATANVSYGTALFLVAHYHANLRTAANYTPHISRYSPVPGQLAMVEPPLALRPVIHNAHAPPPGAQIWLSSTYKPGDPRLVDVVAAGDVMMGSTDAGLNPAITPGASASSLIGNDLVTIFQRANIAFVNLEGPLYDGPNPPTKTCAHCFAFRSPTYYAGVLQNLGVDVVSLANNHSGDYGEIGRQSTMAALRAHDIAYGGLDRNGARAATLRLPGGRRAAVVAFAPNDGTLDLNDLPAAEKLIRELKKTHDLVIVSFHGGAEGWDHVHVGMGEEMFDGEDRGDVVRFAHGAIDAGADIVIGQGPHVPRAVELYRRHLIAYSLGNFWTYEGVMTYAVSGLGPVLEAWLAPDGSIAGFTIHSTRQAGLGVPHTDPEDEAARYIFYLTKADFPQSEVRLEEAQRLKPNCRQQFASGS
ncbi:MAG: CapA family protein [Alphaproteobacteria bacterium]|nr:CapA family protein [Alphaproteobacteria bacterium]